MTNQPKMNIDLDHNINLTSQTLTDTYKSLIASTNKSYHRKISQQCIKVLTQIRKVTMAMLKYILRDFPWTQVRLLTKATKPTEFYFDCATETSIHNIYWAKRALHIQIEACRLKRLVQRQLAMLDDKLIVNPRIK